MIKKTAIWDNLTIFYTFYFEFSLVITIFAPKQLDL